MIRTLILASISVLALSACGSPEPSSTRPPPSSPPADPAPVPEAPTVPAPANTLTAQGFGPLRIGMSRAEVEAAMGLDAQPDAVGGADPDACDMFHPARAPEGLLVMIENGVLTSVWLTQVARVGTDRDLNIGDTAAQVRAAYGSSLAVEPHKYQAPPAEYLVAWATPDHQGVGARGVKYEIGLEGTVTSIAGGGPSITYVEGCA